MSTLLLFVGMVLGLILIPFGLPGTIIIFVSVLIYAFATDFLGGVGVVLVVILGLLTLIAETADNWLTALGARQYGASTAAMWLSLLGGLTGAILIGGPLAFILGPFGPIVGGFAGAFLVVVLYEYSQGKEPRAALRAGWGTFVGRLAGIVLKVVIAVTMIVTVAIAVLF